MFKRAWPISVAGQSAYADWQHYRVRVFTHRLSKASSIDEIVVATTDQAQDNDVEDTLRNSQYVNPLEALKMMFLIDMFLQDYHLMQTL